MSTHNKMMLCTICIGLNLVSIIIGVIDFQFADTAQTICDIVALLCMIVLFISVDDKNHDYRNGSLIVNDADEVYLVLDSNISELRKKSHIDLSVYLSHSS